VDRAEEADFEGEDLDVPGRTLPDDKKDNSLKDEENQLHSQGGEDNENLEQDSGATRFLYSSLYFSWLISL
jgi:hypothetical protein